MIMSSKLFTTISHVSLVINLGLARSMHSKNQIQQSAESLQIFLSQLHELPAFLREKLTDLPTQKMPNNALSHLCKIFCMHGLNIMTKRSRHGSWLIQLGEVQQAALIISMFWILIILLL